MKKITFLFVCALMLIQNIQAQKWTQMLNDTNANFYDIVKEFDAYWKDKPYERGKGYKAFKRWQWFTEPRVYPTGNMRLASRGHALEEYKKSQLSNGLQHQVQTQSSASSTVANWVPLGPFGSPSGGDAGRIQVIKVHPTNTNVIYVGAAAGGFWMTNNGGTSYTTTTDQLASLGVSDIAIDLINPSNIYISTGDKDAGDTHATGVLKSTNGGQTWTQTGLVWQTSQLRRIYRLLINPLNGNTLFAATSVGLYRTLNAGATWSLMLPGSYVDAEYRPNDTTTIYLVDGASVYKSTNGGNTFGNLLLPGSNNLNRLSLAVTPANNNYVYVLASNNNNGFGGLYRSTNGAASFSLMSSSPNIFDWSTNGSGTGGQGWYDIALDASPTNANEIIAGGVNSWKSTTGGSSWTLNSHWTGSGGRPYVHADLHYVMYTAGNTVYLGTDGGIARTVNGGASYQTINGNMNIAQIYKIGLSASNASRMVTGHQDNGSNLSNGAAWSAVYGGDGTDCFIDRTNNNTIVASTQNGGFVRTFFGGGNWSNITNGLFGTGAWVAPIVQDPTTANTYYCGYQNVFRSMNQGSSWTQISSFNSTLDEIKISPLGSNTIIASGASGIWRTTNAGVSWSLINGTIPVAGVQITDICMDNQNPNNIFATLSGFNTGNKVFKTNDAGVTWTNYSTGLPNIPINCIVFVNNSAQGVYVGTDVGVYYREASMSSWLPYNNGLPNVIIDDMEIYYPTSKLRAATYGRSVWETDLYSDPLALPVCSFYNNFNSACVNTPFQFSDATSNNPITWNWIFNGGSPATSTLQNPVITYSNAGIYTINLVAGNNNGFSTPYVSTISVVNAPTVATAPASICIGQNVQLSLNTNANNVVWSSGQQGLSVFVSPSVTTVYNFSAALGACNTLGSNTVFVSTNMPSTPDVYAVGNLLTTSATAISYQWYLNGAIIPNATAQVIMPVQAGYYSVWVSNDGCSASSDSYLFEFTGISKIDKDFGDVVIQPNPVKDELVLNVSKSHLTIYEIQIIDVLGRIVTTTKNTSSAETWTIRLNIQNQASGIYFINLKSETKNAQLKFIKQ